MVDQGTSLSSCAEALRKYGDCEEHLWPYEKKLVNVKPSQAAYEEASRFTIIPIQVPINMKAIKTALAHGFPCIIGIVLRRSAGTRARQGNGCISIPDASSTTVRNSDLHAVVLCGYNEKDQYFIVRNSWGTRWVKYRYQALDYQDYLCYCLGFEWLFSSSVRLFG